MKTLVKTTLSLLLAGCMVSSAWAQRAPSNADKTRVLAAIKKSTQFMMDEVGYKGAFVWSYLPDLSRQWGEMEAFRTMGWTQWEGSPEVGDFLLDLYKATGDEYYYDAAEIVASALIWGQHPSGGWNYHFDLAGEASVRHWYNTIGKNGRRLEEFRHYRADCTFDDDATASPARFILRLYRTKNDPKYIPSIEKTVQFLLESQYPIGGWPQRYPNTGSWSVGGMQDYSHYITFNDGVMENNTELLLMYYRALGDKSLLEPIRRAMNCLLLLQQGQPNPGWGDQFDLELKPTHARGFEPPHINSRMTYDMLEVMMTWYKHTGETKFLARIPEAIAWLESILVPDSVAAASRNRRYQPGLDAAPMFLEPETNRPISSRVENGRYIINYDNYGLAIFDMAALKTLYQETIKITPDEARATSPLYTTEPFAFPDYVAMKWPELERVGSIVYRNPLFGEVIHAGKPTLKEINDLIAAMVDGKYWLVDLQEISHPFVRDPETPEELTGRAPGNTFDMSPFRPDPAVKGITTRSWMINISRMARFVLDY
ncbi:MAG: pectate lyase [Bacteroidales bacterium]|nr:pectate lyase [Bacteroidales bacterium]